MKMLDIRKELAGRIMVLDGAMGTMIQRFRLGESDFRGDVFKEISRELKGDNECLNLTRPDVIKAIHKAYIDAGADIIESNTFGANCISQAEYGLQDYAYEMARRGVQLAREAADEAGRKIWVAGSMGPTGKSLSLASDIADPDYRAVDFDAMTGSYREQIRGLRDAGADMLLIETCFDALNVKAALYAASEIAPQMPVMVSVAVSDRSGRTLTGQTMEAFYTSVRHAPLLSFGLNCSFGADELESLVESLQDVVECPISFYPNAGLPNEMGEYDQSPEEMSAAVRKITASGFVNIVGGCCGTTPEHIAAVRKAVEALSPRMCPPAPEMAPRLTVCGLECAAIDSKNGNLTNIGERTNVAGSRKFARLIASGAYNEALQVAADQIEGGACIIDINMDDAMLDSQEQMRRFLRHIANDPAVAKAALMIDSSHFDTVVTGLKNAQGKCIVNSISLKEGEAAFIEKAREIHKFGAAVVVMAFDEQGQAVDYQRKIDICRRAYDILVGKLGFAPNDIIFDVNVLSVGTGIAEHARYGVDFIEAVRWIKGNLPGALTSGGISNLSFAFRGNNAVREAMHTVFLYHAVAAGLDMGIVNPAMLQIYDDIEPGLLERVEDVVLNRREDATERLIEYASQMNAAASAVEASVSEVVELPDVRERLVQALVKGKGSSLAEDVLECLGKCGGNAVDVIEGPLMEGMEKVGKMFGEGRMFLPQVVKSAKIMRDAVEVLSPYMKGDDSAQEIHRPKVVIATVKGDVHDIGKNITAIVLRCNGFDVTDLGVMVPSETILSEAERLGADIIAASGLITPSLSRMEELCSMMASRGMTVPLLIGGATTSALHTAVKLSPLYDHVYYGSDASSSAVMAKRYIMDAEGFEMAEREKQQAIRMQYQQRCQRPSDELDGGNEVAKVAPESDIAELSAALSDISCRELSLDELMPYFDWKMMNALWGFKYVDSVNPEALKLQEDALARLEQMSSQGLCHVRVSARFFAAEACGDDIVARLPEGEKVFPMMRQDEGPRLSLADYVSGGNVMGCFAVSVHGHATGCACPECSAGTLEYGSLLDRTLRMTLAEAASSWLDAYLRESIPSKYADYRICKPAAGYASCPDHSLKKDILALLPGADGLEISLTDSYAMIPDASICGFIFMHPQASYPEIRHLSREAVGDYVRRRGLSSDEARLLLGHLL